MIAPIQARKPGCIGVLSFTDVELFNKGLSNYCFGNGIPAYGGGQSIRSLRPDMTDDDLEDEKEEESMVL